jgi:heme/copper-type cytochrome/quinol oxidase subunit 3
VTDYVQGARRLGEVPLTTEATNGAAVSAAIARRTSAPAALWGMGILIASEATLFATFIGTYYYLRFHTAVWPPAGVPKPDWVNIVVPVAALATTSIPMHLAWLSVKRGRVAPARLHLIWATFIGAGYFAFVFHDFFDQLQKTEITRNAYTSIYYTLLGADHAHVFVGLLFNVWLLAKLARGLTTYRANAMQAISWYWHFVNALTIVVAATLLSALAG